MIIRPTTDHRLTLLELSRDELDGLVVALLEWSEWEDHNNFGEGYASDHDRELAALVHLMMEKFMTSPPN